ncbi:HAMP domain-containing sensor histidine kinase [Actinosynnema sp. NPDC050436]|uniref:sensor histidine kinase n=1 Tax=Actinosynnema sp. NPDC050436 TaxID=3155659 RepID=UPI0033FA69E1
MRRHLVAVLTTLPTVVVCALGWPLAMHRIDRAGHELVITRIGEAEQLVDHAAAVLRRQSATAPERLLDYERDSAATVVVVDPDGRAVYGAPCADADPPVMEQRAVRVALRGGHLESASYSVDDGRSSLVVATPVIRDREHWGAVITCSSLAGLKVHGWTVWATTAVIEILAIALSALLAEPLSRWLLRPVRLFDRAAHRFAAGDYAARVAVDGGPPELRVLGETFNRMADQLQRTLQAQRSFVGDASHQLRNPLVALRLRLENLEPHVKPCGRSQMDAALREATRMGLILNALLTLTRAEGSNAAYERVDVAATLEDRAASWQVLAHSTDVRVLVEPGADLRALALPGTLDQILDVFLDNAIRVSPPGGRIAVGAEVAGTSVVVYCRDQGPGMTPEEAGRACDRFWRGPQTLDTEGSGLGLSIAVSLAHASNGRIRLQPVSTGGLEAAVVLPLWTVDHDTPSARGRDGART